MSDKTLAEQVREIAAKMREMLWVTEADTLDAIAEEVHAAKDDADIYKAEMIDEGIRRQKLQARVKSLESQRDEASLGHSQAIKDKDDLQARVKRLEELLAEGDVIWGEHFDCSASPGHEEVGSYWARASAVLAEGGGDD